LSTLFTNVTKMWWSCWNFAVEIHVETGTECTKKLFCAMITAQNWWCWGRAERCVSNESLVGVVVTTLKMVEFNWNKYVGH
jgi:hypothetical protein